MTIITNSDNAGSIGVKTQYAPKMISPEKIFARHLEDQMAQTGQATTDGEDPKKNKYAADIAAIREKGLTAYVRELEAEKMKKLREEILSAMGLTEEDLGKMSPEQRATIEKIVADEIEKRLTAMSVFRNGTDTDEEQALPKEFTPGKGGDYDFNALMKSMDNLAGHDDKAKTDE